MRNATHPIPGQARPGERHPVDAEGGAFVDHHRRGVQLLIALHGGVQVLGEDGGLEGVRQGIGKLDSDASVQLDSTAPVQRWAAPGSGREKT